SNPRLTRYESASINRTLQSESSAFIFGYAFCPENPGSVMNTPIQGYVRVGFSRLFNAMIPALALAVVTPDSMFAQAPGPATRTTGMPTSPGSISSAPPAAESGDLVKLPEFTVSTAQDKGYLAGNSVSGTRINT